LTKAGKPDRPGVLERIAKVAKEDPDDPLEVAARQPFLDPKDRDSWVEGLRLAGLRERAEGGAATSAP
jgi:hypothetical protein